jgi:fumarate hydratase class II
MLQIEDTQLTDVNYQPGTLLDGGKWRVEFDSMGQVKCPRIDCGARRHSAP